MAAKVDIPDSRKAKALWDERCEKKCVTMQWDELILRNFPFAITPVVRHQATSFFFSSMSSSLSLPSSQFAAMFRIEIAK